MFYATHISNLVHTYNNFLALDTSTLLKHNYELQIIGEMHFFILNLNTIFKKKCFNNSGLCYI